jgi:hypothetical protein
MALVLPRPFTSLELAVKKLNASNYCGRADKTLSLPICTLINSLVFKRKNGTSEMDSMQILPLTKKQSHFPEPRLMRSN